MVAAYANEGARLLDRALTAGSISRYRGERECNGSDGSFGRLLSGQRKPGREYALRIAERFNVPVSAWDEPPKAEVA